MAQLDKVSSALFDKIRSRFDVVTLGDENAKATNDPEQARFFNFDYQSQDGENFGNITISLIDDDSLKIYFGKNITEPLNDEQQEEWFKFLRDIRQFARRNMLTFDTRDISRSNLDLRDLRQASKAGGNYSAADMSAVTESQMFGSRRTSYQQIGPAKLIVRHGRTINDEVRGARTRTIECVFVETAEGERFKMPFNNLHGARAIARHLAQGGTMLDERTAHITETVNELQAMSQFVRSMQHRVFEDQETTGMVEAAAHRYGQLKKNLKSMRGSRGYAGYFGSWNPTDAAGEAANLDDLKDRFTKKLFDDRLAQALPYVHRAYTEYKMNETKMSQEFEQWANEISEISETIGAGSVSDQDVQQLRNLFQSEIPTGIDGLDAIAALKQVIADSALHDNIYELSQIAGEAADARPVIFQWVEDNRPDLVDRLDYQPTAETNQPTQLAQPTDAQMPNETASTESIDFIRHLAGLKR